MPSVSTRAVERIALCALLTSVFGELHPIIDHGPSQTSAIACAKRCYGDHEVYSDGKPVDGSRPGARTWRATTRGRQAAVIHAGLHTAMQTGAAMALTRALGYRVPMSAWAVSALVNGVTHAAIDRGALLLWLADRTGWRGYIEHATAARVQPDGTVVREVTGPGTAWLALDDGLHRAIAVLAAALATWLATRR